MNRRARMAKLGRAHPLGVVAIVAQTALAAALVVFLFNGIGVKVPLVDDDRYVIEAAFDDAAGLNEDKRPPVMVAGVPLGLVTDVRYERGQAIARMELEEEARGKVFSNATASVFPESGLNILAVEIDPGDPGSEALPGGAPIPQNRTSAPVYLDRLAGVLDIDTRAHLQVLVDQLRTGVRGRSPALRAALRELGPALDQSGRVAAALADRRRTLARLVRDLDVVFGSFGRRGQDLQAIVGAGRRTLGTVAARQRELAGALRELAPMLGATTRSMGEITRLARPLTPALTRLRPFADALPGGLAALRSFVPSGRGLARDLDALTRDGSAPLRDLQRLASELGPASTALTPSFARLEPIVRSLDRNRNGIGEFASNFSGVYSGQDVNGPTQRALGFFEVPRPENFGITGASAQRRSTLRSGLADLLERVCKANELACAARYLVPRLPGSFVQPTRRSGR